MYSNLKDLYIVHTAQFSMRPVQYTVYRALYTTLRDFYVVLTVFQEPFRIYSETFCVRQYFLSVQRDLNTVKDSYIIQRDL